MTMGGARGLSADQLLSAVGLESPLRPEAPGMFDDPPPPLPTPPTTEPLTLKPLNWNSRERGGVSTFNKLGTTDEGGEHGRRTQVAIRKEGGQREE